MITEEARYQMHQGLNEVLGKEQATTLMEHLPPVGWADVATKRDLELLEMKLIAHMHRELRHQFQAIVGTNVALMTVALTIAALIFRN